MEFARAVARRRMTRAYDPGRPLDPAAVEMLIKHAIRSPSAGNSQGWHFVVLSEPADVTRYWSATVDPARPADSWLRGMRTAPVLVLVLCSRERYLDRYAEPDKGWGDRDPGRWLVPYWYVDAGMASMAMLLGAVDAGLGACFFGVPAHRWPQVRTAFAVPDEWLPVGVLSLGHPDDTARSRGSALRGRRPRAEVVSHGRFGTGG